MYFDIYSSTSVSSTFSFSAFFSSSSSFTSSSDFVSSTFSSPTFSSADFSSSTLSLSSFCFSFTSIRGSSDFIAVCSSFELLFTPSSAASFSFVGISDLIKSIGITLVSSTVRSITSCILGFLKKKKTHSK